MEPAKSLLIFVLIAICNTSYSQNINIKAYFNNDTSKAYIDPYRNIKKPGDNFEQILIDLIDNAQYTVDVAVQELNLTNLAKALVRAKKRGVRVRVVIEDSYNRVLARMTEKEVMELNEHAYNKVIEHLRFIDGNPRAQRFKDLNITESEIKNRDAIEIIREGGVEVIDDENINGNIKGLMHHKFVIVDGRMLAVSSANFTRSGTHGDYDSKVSIGNANALVVIPDAKLANYFLVEFETMFVKGRFKYLKPFRKIATFKVGSIPMAVKFSPTDINRIGWEVSTNALIVNEISKANKSFYGNFFVLSAQEIGNAMYKVRKKNPNMVMEVLIDWNFATQYYSNLLDMWGLQMRDQRCNYQVDNFVWRRNPLSTGGIPFLREGDKLHHKFAVIDEEVVIFGSHNWSKSANARNDETLLLFKSPVLARQFIREHKRIFSNALLRPPKHTIDKIRERERSCAGGSNWEI